MLSRRDDPAAAFARIDLSARSGIVVGLSGGSDSTALLVLLHEWLRRNRPGCALLAVTVDHRLRPESAREAWQMAEFCAGLGIAHRISEWRDGRPSSAIAATAREARYRLLAEAAAEAGTDLVLVAHTADDQAETVMMRLARGEGSGLAGMAASTLLDGWCWIVRPLLGCRRDMLREELRRRGIGWIDDPGNADPVQERVRVRKALREQGRTEEMLTLAALHGARRARLSAAAATRISTGAASPSPGLVRFARGEADDAWLQAVRVLLALCGGRPHLPAVAATRDLLSRLAGGRAALARTLVTPRRAELFLHRELRDLPEADEDGIYDGRYRIGRDAVRQGWRLVRRHGRGRSLAASALATVPVLRAPPPPAAAPPAVEPVLAPFDRFLPGFDLDTAQAAARLMGRRPYPPAPMPEWPERA